MSSSPNRSFIQAVHIVHIVHLVNFVHPYCMAPVDQLFDMVGMFHLVHKQIVYVAPFLKNLHAFHAGHAVHVIQF